ncbi:hypothetical protein [Campylobacter sp. Cr9]
MIEIDIQTLNLSLEQFNFLMSLTAVLLGFCLFQIIIFLFTRS